MDVQRGANGRARVRIYLDSLPSDEVKENAALSGAIGLSLSALGDIACDPALRDYREIHHRRRLWGNPRAIAELRRQSGLGVSK